MSVAAAAMFVSAGVQLALLVLAGRNYRALLKAHAQQAVDFEQKAGLRYRALNLCCHEVTQFLRAEGHEFEADTYLDRRVRINAGVRIDPETLIPDPPEVQRVDRS